MYSEAQINELKAITERAGEKMTEVKSQLERLYDLEQKRGLELRAELLGWQSWLGAIAFTLSGISGTILIDSSKTSLWTLIASLIFFSTGIWVAVFKKRQSERSLVTRSIYPEFIKQYDKQKKSAYNAYNDPTQVNKSQLEINKAQVRILNLSINDARQKISEYEKGRISYVNDIWTCLLFLGIYFLLIPSFADVYRSFDLYDLMMIPIFILTPVLVVLLMARDAMRSRTLVLQHYKIQVDDNRYEIRKLNEYLTYLRKTNKDLQRLLKNSQ